MTVEEMRAKLESMTDPEFQQFANGMGAVNAATREHWVDVFIVHPEEERRMAHLLGFPTEQERQTKAMVDSALAAKNATRAAWISASAALLSLIVSIVALYCSMHV